MNTEALTPEILEERFAPTHLIPKTTEDLAKEVAEQATPKTAQEDTEAKEPMDPRGLAEYSFDFSWTDAQGKKWEGQFTTHILTIRERSLSGIMHARLNASLPQYALDDLTHELNFIVARTHYCLDQQPDWFKNPLELRNFKLVQAVYVEVASHEDYFLGDGSDTQAGQGGA